MAPAARPRRLVRRLVQLYVGLVVFGVSMAMMNADGKSPKQLTNSAVNELPGDWSRDMKYAVVNYYFSSRTEGQPISDLAIVDLTRGTVSKLTNTEEIREENPFWLH